MFLTRTRLFLIACGYLKDSYYQSKYVPVPEIAGYYKMNARALMPAFVSLTHAGILRSRVGGTEPGFILSRDPSTINMLEVLKALEPNPCFMCCKDITDVEHYDCCGDDKCQLYNVINSTIEDMKIKMSQISLKEYCEKKRLSTV